MLSIIDFHVVPIPFNKIRRYCLELESVGKANTAKKRQVRQHIVESEAAKLKR